VPKRHYPQKYDRAEAARLYREGWTQKQLAARYPMVCEETIRRHLLADGVPMRRRGYPTGKYLPSGGRILDKTGYVLVRHPDHPQANNAGYVREHRYVMEQHLGRYLDSQEVVHHRNGDKQDNRLENLELYEHQSEHYSEHMRGNSYSKGLHHRRTPHKYRTPEQILAELRALMEELDRPLHRCDLVPPHPSWRAVQRAFGTWQAAAELARRSAPSPTATAAACRSR
jgi:hypothetical protein